MLRKIESKNMGKSEMDWLKSIFHFSFADYYNTDNINFGALRVLNDDLIESKQGFDTHPHRDMEIISYVVDGELTHWDSMGNKRTLSRGHVQYMSAGTGVFHSEHNLGDEILRILQIWILPDAKGYRPSYGDYTFEWNVRRNKWLQIVSGKEGSSPVKINQDANFYVLELEKDKSIAFPVNVGRQSYLVLIEGIAEIDDISLEARDALEIVEEDVLIEAKETAHLLVIEMKKQ